MFELFRIQKIDQLNTENKGSRLLVADRVNMDCLDKIFLMGDRIFMIARMSLT